MSLALLVVGASGAVGTALLDLVRSERNTFARGLRRQDLDLTDPFAIKDMVSTWGRLLRSDSGEHRLVVVNAAALPADLAALDEDEAYAVNATAPALLAQSCAGVGARLLHVSCADVFADAAPPAPYDVDAEPAPGSAHGRTKLAGEQAVRTLLPDAGYVVRTGWLHDGPRGGGLVGRLAREPGPTTVSADRAGSPTWTRDLAAGLLALAAAPVAAGVYHVVNAGTATELELARAVLGELSAGPDRITQGPAPRHPGTGPLSPAGWDAAGLPALPHWRTALSRSFAAAPAG